VEQLGVGPKTVSYHALTAGKLAAQIRQAAEDGGMRMRAAEFGRRISSERGVAEAVECITGHLESRNPPA
jgi:UDP:flavonoid glycosyltransferase YjiC (YdhE family)